MSVPRARTKRHALGMTNMNNPSIQLEKIKNWSCEQQVFVILTDRLSLRRARMCLNLPLHLSRPELLHFTLKSCYYMNCVCGRYNARSDWLRLGHYSPVMPMGPLQACKNQAKSHIINYLLTSNVRSLRENL